MHILVSGEAEVRQAQEDGFINVLQIDFTKDEVLEALSISSEDTILCMMDDTHLNVFLILSLRALFPDTIIIAVSDSIHTTQKLKMAGASKVIDLYNVSASRIHSILKKPVATKLLDGFISKDKGISFKEMTIPSGSYLDHKLVDDIDFHKHKILLVGMIDVELSHKFIFVTSGINHKLDAGDIIVCIGDKVDLDRFEMFLEDNVGGDV
ncbi:MAG TPA: TrkA family potassium uptake protein, partial [Epsilonproteobacteria bacterium]|nr:TrkA family potassium uptake protein [Campylobacterota bacterium]